MSEIQSTVHEGSPVGWTGWVGLTMYLCHEAYYCNHKLFTNCTVNVIQHFLWLFLIPTTVEHAGSAKQTKSLKNLNLNTLQNTHRRYFIFPLSTNKNAACITYLEVTMNHISRMQVFYGFEQLIHNVLLVDVLQYIASFDHIVQVSVYNFRTWYMHITPLQDINILCNTDLTDIWLMKYSVMFHVIMQVKFCYNFIMISW